MNQLLEKFNEYKSIVNYRVIYEFEDGNTIEFVPKQTDFPHLIGLHKLVDLPIIRQFNDKSNQTVSVSKTSPFYDENVLNTDDVKELVKSYLKWD